MRLEIIDFRLNANVIVKDVLIRMFCNGLWNSIGNTIFSHSITQFTRKIKATRELKHA